MEYHIETTPLLLAENLCIVSLNCDNKHLTYIIFKYFIDTQYRRLTSMYYLFCNKYLKNREHAKDTIP